MSTFDFTPRQEAIVFQALSLRWSALNTALYRHQTGVEPLPENVLDEIEADMATISEVMALMGD